MEILICYSVRADIQQGMVNVIFGIAPVASPLLVALSPLAATYLVWNGVPELLSVSAFNSNQFHLLKEKDVWY